MLRCRLRALAHRLTIAALASLLPACASAPREPWVLASADLKAGPTRVLDDITSYPQALATALDIMQRDLGLPPVQVRLVFLPDAATFEALLLQVGYTPALARDSARLMTAIGGHRAVLINQARLERDGWPRRVAMVAHELGHVLQYEVGGGERGTSAQWLREGFAEWLALRVMEVLDRVDGRDVRREARWRVSSRKPGEVPRLSELSSFARWVERSRAPAGDTLYDYALVAVSWLVDRHGPAAIVRYFALFAARQDPGANFLEAFGEREEEFDERLRTSFWPTRAQS